MAETTNTKKYLDLVGLQKYDTKIKDYANISISTETTSEGAAKSYTVSQNNNTLAVIDIPKDMVVSSGRVVTYAEGDTFPDGVTVAGTYIELTISNATSDKIYVNVGTLVDIYTAQADAAQIQLAINSSTREISASIVAKSVGTNELADASVTTDKLDATLQTAIAQISTNTTAIEALQTETFTAITDAEIDALFSA